MKWANCVGIPACTTSVDSRSHGERISGRGTRGIYLAPMLDDSAPTDSLARRRARVDLLLTFGELPWQDQYRVYEVIQGYFFHFGPSADALDELRKRAKCVTAVQRVAKHLGLPAGEMPGVK